ncbi:MAG: leucine-rich repeat domain-containing protein [Oscillospiraceae bacterium]|nr:leucine-rich repeat domain-containing protein [Oscillospiraceae bacterium]
MKKHLKAFAALLAGALLLPVMPLLPGHAEYGEDDTWSYNDYGDGVVSVTLLDKETAGKIEVPEKINGLTVTMIEVDCFNSCTNLTAVKLPDTITVIDDYSFYGCTALTEVNIPQNVQKIGMKAFYNCSAMEDLQIPANTGEIGDFAFEGCSALTGVQVADGNTHYKDEDGILFDIDGTTLILYPSQKTDTQYAIPDGCTRIEDYAFIGNTYLEAIDMQHITELGRDAFYYCTSLKTAEVPDSITVLEGSVFGNCTSLESVKLPQNLEEIGEGCFYACMALKEIEIPETVTAIRNYAFFNCPLLKTIRVSANVTQIGDYALGYYYSDGDQPSRLPGFEVDAENGTEAFTYCVNNSIKCTGGVTQRSVFVIIILCVVGLVILITVGIIIMQRQARKKYELN